MFLEFRLIPVLLWSYTAVAVGTGVALAEGAPFDPWLLAVAMALAVLDQAGDAQAGNDVFDWSRGTDGGRVTR